MNDGLVKRLLKFKWPIIILCAGVLLMLLPGKSEGTYPTGTPEERLACVLSASKGVGEAKVLISDSGVVVACRGADSAQVRLRILSAVESYTGFSSDKVTVLILE